MKSGDSSGRADALRTRCCILAYPSSGAAVLCRTGLFVLRRISGGRIVFYGLCYRITAAHVFAQLIFILFYRLHAALRRRIRIAPCLVFPCEIRLITSAFLKSKRRLLVVIAFVLAAVVSPTTDVFTQVMIAVPMIVLYEASIVLVRFILRK